MILHVVSTSPFTDNHLSDCLDIITSNDALLLMGDGVYALVKHESWANLPPLTEVFAIEEDCLARAVTTPIDAQLQLISFNDMVNITTRYPLSQSWF